MRFHSFPGRFTKMQMELQKENIHFSLGCFFSRLGPNLQGMWRWDPQPQCWGRTSPGCPLSWCCKQGRETPGKLWCLSIQRREPSCPQGGWAWLGRARSPPWSQRRKNNRHMYHISCRHPENWWSSLIWLKGRKAEQKEGDKQNPQVMEFPSLMLSKHLCLPASLTPCNFTQFQRAHNSFLKVRWLISWDIPMVKNTEEKRETSLPPSPKGVGEAPSGAPCCPIFSL